LGFKAKAGDTLAGCGDSTIEDEVFHGRPGPRKITLVNWYLQALDLGQEPVIKVWIHGNRDGKGYS
jgi:hypothetical protein